MQGRPAESVLVPGSSPLTARPAAEKPRRSSRGLHWLGTATTDDDDSSSTRSSSVLTPSSSSHHSPVSRSASVTRPSASSRLSASEAAVARVQASDASALAGWLKKKHRHQKDSRQTRYGKRYFEVDENQGTLGYSKSEGKKQSVVLPIADITQVDFGEIIELPSAGASPTLFMFSITCPPVYLTVGADTEEGRAAWVYGLRERVDTWRSRMRYISEYVGYRVAIESPASSGSKDGAPRWQIPQDGEARKRSEEPRDLPDPCATRTLGKLGLDNAADAESVPGRPEARNPQRSLAAAPPSSSAVQQRDDAVEQVCNFPADEYCSVEPIDLSRSHDEEPCTGSVPALEGADAATILPSAQEVHKNLVEMLSSDDEEAA